MNRIYMIIKTMLILTFVCYSAIAKPIAPIDKNAWAKSAEGLSGRIVVTKGKITTSEYFQLTLELRNIRNIPLAIQTENPHTFSIQVLNSAGKKVKATFARIDILSSPQWAIIPRNSYLGFPVSFKSTGGTKGSHLDITTLIWKLPTGKYRICGEYFSSSFTQFNDKPKNVNMWQGKIVLPQIGIEVVEDN